MALEQQFETTEPDKSYLDLSRCEIFTPLNSY